jgi:glycosidase
MYHFSINRDSLRLPFLAFIISLLTSNAQAQVVTSYPVSWWTGMKHPVVQVMLHGMQDLPSGVSVSYPGVSVKHVHQPENKRYLFVDLHVSPATKPGNVAIRLGKDLTVNFPLNERTKQSITNGKQGVLANDLVYLIMPDRFVNGDPANDRIASLRDTSCDRNDPFARHGGDLKGVEQKLDYLKDLGVTTLWMTPVVENDMPRTLEAQQYNMSGYHGYWITNHYKIDPRLGGNEAYRSLVDGAHEKGMKIIQDAVYNHVGNKHHTVIDPPMKDWLNQWPTYQGSNHRDEVFFDPYASASDKKIMIGGWFVPHLPDLNLANPYVANFIIQNTVWHTERFGIDGWRVDTYKYCDEAFLNRINDVLLKEFPRLTVFGEAWTNTITGGAYFTRNNMNAPFKHNAQGVTDFPLGGAIFDAVNQPAGWTEGVGRLYMTLAQDVLYEDPMRNCIFLDNHDMNRLFSMVGERMDRYKMALGLLFTIRGIPQIYYGTEVLARNFKNPTDAAVRLDFPGGWKGDKLDKFNPTSLTEAEQDAFRFVKTLANFRKSSSAIGAGKTTQFIPSDGVYVYFRYDNRQTVMCVLNTNDKKVAHSLSRYAERTSGFSNAREVLSGQTISLNTDLELPPNSIGIFELGR